MKKKIRLVLGRIRNVIVKIFNIFPLKDAIIFESNPDFNDEGYWLCKKFIEERVYEQCKIYWYLKKHDLTFLPEEWIGMVDFIYLQPNSFSEWIKKYYVLHTSKYIIDSCQFVYKSREKQFRFFLTHGMAIKRTAEYIRELGEIDYISIGAHYHERFFGELGIEKRKMVSLGLCRNDALGVKSESLKKIIPQCDEYKNKIIWMPTYKQHISGVNNEDTISCASENTGLPILQEVKNLESINAVLQDNNVLLIIKVHPSQDLSYMSLKNFSNIIILTNDMLQEHRVQLYSLLNQTDALITDYSSIYYDYLLLGRPIGITMNEIEELEKKNYFAIQDFKKEIRGYHIYSYGDFVDYIEKLSLNNAFLEKEIEESREYFHDIIDFSSTEKIFEFLCKQLKIGKYALEK